jgi:hypothetical protein
MDQCSDYIGKLDEYRRKLSWQQQENEWPD